MTSPIQSLTRYLMVFCLILLTTLHHTPGRAAEEDTYAISLVQTAEVDKQIIEVEGKKVLTESYEIKEGDHLWQLLRERGLLAKRDLPKLLAMLKGLNRSLANLDLIHPGQEIIIPLTIAPVKGSSGMAGKKPEIPITVAELKDMDLENYTVKPGDSLTKIISKRYDILSKALYSEYLELVKKLNPTVGDLDLIYPNQKIRLPVYSPHMVRGPIKEPLPAPPPQEQKDEAARGALFELSNRLGSIFLEMGEQWVNTGQHFIPLKSGGQATFNAESFPVINLSNGNRIIVDIHREMPSKIAQVIQSDWKNYRIIALEKGIDLKGALDRILPLCSYFEIYPSGEPLELGGDMSIHIAADWVIRPVPPSSENPENQIIALTLTDPSTPRIPREIKGFLKGLGVEMIEYPPEAQSEVADEIQKEILRPGNQASDLIETLLKISGRKFSKTVEIPVYKGQKKDFDLMIKADFFLNAQKKDAIIDLSGLGPEIISLLREHNFSVLSLTGEKDPLVLITKALDFLGTPFDSEPRSFMATSGPETRNIRITIPGITFRDSSGQSILATPLNLPGELAGFLSRRGYKILLLSLT